MKKLHIGFHETMSGSYYETCTIKKQFVFTVDATASLCNLITPLTGRFMLTDLDGTVTMEGVCKDSPIYNGKLHLDFLGDQVLKYTFSFKNDEKRFDYIGKKILSLRNPIESMTTLHGGIYESRLEDGKAGDILRTKSHFDLDELLPYLLSFAKGLKFKYPNQSTFLY